MAQNVTIAGRQYSAVPAIDVPKTGGGTATFTDVTDTTRIAGDVRQGKYFFTASGVLTLGTATGGGEESSYELLRSAEFEAHTTSTTARTIGTITTAHRADSIIFVKIRDKAGKRNSHFFGSDNLFVDLPKANGGADTLLSYCMRVLYGVTSTGAYYGPNVSGTFANTNSANGVTAKQFAKSGAITITAKYNSNYGIIDGTYIVEIYALKWPGNDSPLE